MRKAAHRLDGVHPEAVEVLNVLVDGALDGKTTRPNVQ